MFVNKIKILGMNALADRLVKVSKLIDIDDFYNKESVVISKVFSEFSNKADIWFGLILLMYKYIYETEDNMRVAIYKIIQCSIIDNNTDNIKTNTVLMIDNNYKTINTIKRIMKSTYSAVNYCRYQKGILGYKEHITKYSRNLENTNNGKIYENFGFTNLIQLNYMIPEKSLRCQGIADSMDRKQRQFIGTYNDIEIVYDMVGNYENDKLREILRTIVFRVQCTSVSHKNAIRILSDEELWERTIKNNS